MRFMSEVCKPDKPQNSFFFLIPFYYNNNIEKLNLGESNKNRLFFEGAWNQFAVEMFFIHPVAYF